MGGRNRVAWREGMFLRPQHFQAQDRHFEAYVSARHGWAMPFSWGFSEIKIDTALAEVGRFAISSAKGVFPDGTPFSIPGDQPPPPPLAIKSGVRDVVVYLTLPPRQAGVTEFDDSEKVSADSRFYVKEENIRDNFSEELSSESVAFGAPNVRLGVTADETEGRLLLGVGRIREVSGKSLVFDDGYIPPALDIQAVRLKSITTDMIGRCEQMISELALRAAETTEGGQDTYKAFLLLQSLNRWVAILGHLQSMPSIHPERLFENMVGMAGEVSTLTRKERRPPTLPTYDHEDLQGSFEPLINLLQLMLSGELDRSVEPLDLNQRGPGQYLHVIKNKALMKQSYVYLAVADASKSMEEIRTRFPAICKIGASNKMRELVGSSLNAGVPLRHTTTPPTQLHVLPGYVYFELDRSVKDWAEVCKATGMGVFVADTWPQLKLELWAVKQKT